MKMMALDLLAGSAIEKKEKEKIHEFYKVHGEGSQTRIPFESWRKLS